jgi:hypothetical protein
VMKTAPLRRTFQPGQFPVATIRHPSYFLKPAFPWSLFLPVSSLLGQRAVLPGDGVSYAYREDRATPTSASCHFYSSCP